MSSLGRHQIGRDCVPGRLVAWLVTHRYRKWQRQANCDLPHVLASVLPLGQ
jgi:hypothetical protein